MAAISSATPRARRCSTSSVSSASTALAIASGDDSSGLRTRTAPGSQAALGVAELVSGLGQAQLGQALGEGAEEGARACVRDDHVAVPQDTRLVDPPLDLDVVGLGSESVRVAVGADGDEDPDGEAGDCRNGRSQQGQPVLDRAQGDVHERSPVLLEVAGERPARRPVSATGRSGCRAGTWSSGTDWTDGGQMSR